MADVTSLLSRIDVEFAESEKRIKDFQKQEVQEYRGRQERLELFTKAWIDANGGDSKTTKWITLPYPSLYPALANNSVQVVVTSEPWMSAPR